MFDFRNVYCANCKHNVVIRAASASRSQLYVAVSKYDYFHNITIND